MVADMRAIAITRPGGPEVLTLVDRPIPEPGRGEVRVRVRATAVNRADSVPADGALSRAGRRAAPMFRDSSSPARSTRSDPTSERFAVGDRVFGLVGGGAYAEAIVSHERAVAKIPDGMSFEEAAAVPEAFVTAHDAMVSQAHLQGGEVMLVHAAGSGVGTAAIQLARALGAHVIGTARTPTKLERAKSLGLDTSIVSDGGEFADAVRAAAPDGAAGHPRARRRHPTSTRIFAASHHVVASCSSA